MRDGQGEPRPAEGAGTPERAQVVRVEGATVRYADVVAVDEASLTVGRGEVHALLGPSGCGKTTLLRAIGGLETLHAGRVHLDGRLVEDAQDRRAWVPPEDRGVGLVFQDYALFPHLTVAENVAFGRGARAAQCHEHLARVGLEHLAHRHPSELSGGQQQRVALARALAVTPKVLLLDEPFSGVDERLRRDLRLRTAALLRDAGVGALFVTHDVEEAFSLGDRLSVMGEGRVLQTGTPEALYHSPANATVALTVGEATLVAATRDREEPMASCLLGRVPLRTPADGGTVTEGWLVVRPEQVRLAPEGSAEAPADAVRARVVRRAFLGGYVEQVVRLDDGTMLTARSAAGEPGASAMEGHGILVGLQGPMAWVAQASPGDG
jgi:iron(III) transport system ATP-binding protein